MPLIGVSRSGSGVGYSQLQGEYRCSTLVPIEPQRLLFVDSRILPQPDDQEPRSVNTTIKFCDKCVPLCYNWTPSRTIHTQLSILECPQLIRSLNWANAREMLSAGKRGGASAKSGIGRFSSCKDTGWNRKRSDCLFYKILKMSRDAFKWGRNNSFVLDGRSLVRTQSGDIFSRAMLLYSRIYEVLMVPRQP